MIVCEPGANASVTTIPIGKVRSPTSFTSPYSLLAGSPCQVPLYFILIIYTYSIYLWYYLCTLWDNSRSILSCLGWETELQGKVHSFGTTSQVRIPIIQVWYLRSGDGMNSQKVSLAPLNPLNWKLLVASCKAYYYKQISSGVRLSVLAKGKSLDYLSVRAVQLVVRGICME